MHAEAYYCPFCGEQDLWPHGAEHGTWECHGCLRAFQLKTLGIVGREAQTSEKGRTEVNA